LTAFSINDERKIVGFGATTSGDVHAFLAVPCEGDESTTPNARAQRVPVILSPSARTPINGRPGISKGVASALDSLVRCGWVAILTHDPAAEWQN
jgi:probable HAF family extracellular repeat protein